MTDICGVRHDDEDDDDDDAGHLGDRPSWKSASSCTGDAHTQGIQGKHHHHHHHEYHHNHHDLIIIIFIVIVNH